MADSLTPLINSRPGEKSRLWPALEATLRQFDIRSDQLMPVKVIKFDRAKNLVDVQPLIMIVRVDGSQQSRHPLAQLQAISMGGGGFHVSFPIKPGDLGWIIAADRDMSLFKQKLAETAPNTTRCHKFDDGWFIPDVFRQYTINAEDATAMVIQSTDGTTRIAVDTGGNIRITAPTRCLVTTPLAEFSQDVKVNGNLLVEQDANVIGTLTNNSIDVTTHGHVSTPVGTRTGNMEP